MINDEENKDKGRGKKACCLLEAEAAEAEVFFFQKKVGVKSERVILVCFI